MKNSKSLSLKGHSDTSICEIDRFNYLVSIVSNKYNSFAEEQRYVNKVFEALMTQHPALEYAYVFLCLNGDVRYTHQARKLRGSTNPIKIMPNLSLNCNLTEAYFKAQAESEIRYYFRAHQSTYQCLGASWDNYGVARANVPDVAGKLVCEWGDEIAASRFDILNSCDNAPGRWQSNGYHYPNKPSWNLFDKAQSIIPGGFEFTQKAIKIEQAAIVDSIPADYVLIVKDASRYAQKQRSFWDTVKA